MVDTGRIEVVVTEFIRRELLADEHVGIEPDESLFAAGLVDSVGIMRLIAYLESAFEVRVPPTDLVPEHFRSVSAIAAYLARRTPAWPPRE